MKKFRTFVLALSFVLAFSAFVYANALDGQLSNGTIAAGRDLQAKDVSGSAATGTALKNTVPASSSYDAELKYESAKNFQTSKDDNSLEPAGSAAVTAAKKGTSSPASKSTAAPKTNKVSSVKQSSGQVNTKANSNTVTVEEVPGSNGQLFDTSCTGIGLLRINYNNDSGKKIKLSVSKGGTAYIYNLKANGSTESVSLQMGSGQYSISILQNTEGSSYRTVESQSIDVSISNPLKVYLNSIQNINWNSSMAAIIKAKALTKGISSTTGKVNAIYNFVISNISYDKNKLAGLSTDYLPSIDSTLRSGTGICYDYASLFAAMLRSVGVPAKLVKGYTPNAQGYHAWNEVYENGKWVVIDTTYDAQMKASGYKTSMIKSSSQYNKSKEY